MAPWAEPCEPSLLPVELLLPAGAGVAAGAAGGRAAWLTSCCSTTSTTQRPADSKYPGAQALQSSPVYLQRKVVCQAFTTRIYAC